MSIESKAMLINLSISCWSGRKYDRKVSDEIAEEKSAEQSAGRYNKCIINRPVIAKIEKVANKIRIFHYTNTLPWGNEGSRILPSANYFDYTKRFRELKYEFENASNEFINQYENEIIAAQKTLGAMFKQEDYPTKSRIEGAFSVETSVYPIPIASDFRVALGKEEEEKIKNDIENNIKNVINVATKDLWQRLYDVVSKMHNKLKDKDSIFRDSLVENIGELCQLLPKLNVTGDNELEKTRREIESTLLVKPESLRNNETLRETTAAIAENLAAKMAGYIN